MFFFFYPFVSFAQKYDIEISVEELKEFEQFLIEHPLLGTKHLIGEKLFEAIRRHKESGEGSILHRFDDQGIRNILFREEIEKVIQLRYSRMPKCGHRNRVIRVMDVITLLGYPFYT